MSYQHPAAIRRVLTSLVPVICPPEAGPLGLTDAIVDHVALTMGALPARVRQGFLLGIVTYDLGALVWLPGRGRRAHKLPRHLAARYFESWRHGPTPIHRQFAAGVKQLLALAHYEQPAVQAKLGYTAAQWIEKVTKVNTLHMELFAGFIRKLKETPDGDGTLLDHSMIVYGSGIADGNRHTHEDLPVLLVGNGGGAFRPGRHLVYPKDTPMTNLYLTLLDRIGVQPEKVGDSTGRLEHLSDL